MACEAAISWSKYTTVDLPSTKSMRLPQSYAALQEKSDSFFTTYHKQRNKLGRVGYLPSTKQHDVG